MSYGDTDASYRLLYIYIGGNHRGLPDYQEGDDMPGQVDRTDRISGSAGLYLLDVPQIVVSSQESGDRSFFGKDFIEAFMKLWRVGNKGAQLVEILFIG